MKLDEMKQCGEMGRRALKHRHENQVYCVSGESVSVREIAQRGGITPHAMSKKIRKLARDPAVAAITWELLGVK